MMKQLISVSALLLLLVGCSSRITTSDPVVASLKTPRMGHAAVAVGDKIYVLGGSNETGLLSSVEVFDTRSGEVSQLTSKLLPRRYFSAVWDGKESIYILGGVAEQQGRFGLVRWVEVLNTRTGEVTYAAELPEPTRMNAAVRIDKEIWVFGGESVRQRQLSQSDLVAVYNLQQGRWQAGPVMSSGKTVEVAELNGQVYLVGGYNGKSGVNTVERLDASDRSWHAEPALPLATSANAVASCHNTLVSFGDYQQMDRLMLWQPGSATWQQLQLPVKPVRHAAAVRAGDALYLIGGNTGGDGPYLGWVQRFDCGELTDLAAGA